MPRPGVFGVCWCLVGSFIMGSFLPAPFAEGLVCFLLSPLIRAAYLGTLTHLRSPDGADIRGDCPRTCCCLQGAAGSKGPCDNTSAEQDHGLDQSQNPFGLKGP